MDHLMDWVVFSLMAAVVISLAVAAVVVAVKDLMDKS